MANQWLRLWHDMPTDPKWRTIAKASGQRIGDVMAVYLHLLVCASNATERGRTTSFNCEDVASALDLETDQVAKIVDAMQARVLDGDALKGWEKRQPDREDGSAERGRAWRAAQKAAKTGPETLPENAEQTTPNAAERKRTLDKDKEKIKKNPCVVADPDGFETFWARYPRKTAKQDAVKAWLKLSPDEVLQGTILRALSRQSQSQHWRKDGGQFIPHPVTWLNGRRWDDEVAGSVVDDVFAGMAV